MTGRTDTIEARRPGRVTRLVAAAGAAMALAAGPALLAQDPPKGMYKLGTFEQSGRRFVGVVVNDALVADIGAAGAALEKENPGWPKVAAPADMNALMAGYGALRARLGAIAERLGGSQRPAWALDLKSVKTLPPVSPTTILNAAVNYTEHAQEMAGRAGITTGPPEKQPESAPGLWMRKPGDTRHNPYLFLKPTASVIADKDAIRLPEGRTQVDWECELAIVVGTRASHVPVERAAEYIFGYTLQNDVSDRGSRGDSRHGSDWLIGKGHDTFAPLGPFVVPKEFVPNPQGLKIKFTLSGNVMQDSSTERMTHNVYEMLHFASNILTLRPGDVISTGSPAGVGAARGVYMKAGDTAVCTIGHIGTLTNPVVGAGAPPSSADMQ